MIACGDRVGAAGEDSAQDFLADAETAGGVFPVDDDEIEPKVGDKAR